MVRYSVLAIAASASLISASVLGLLPISDLALSTPILTLFSLVLYIPKLSTSQSRLVETSACCECT